ncbi:MAG: NAD(P)(+) transhydrogenase (Re/Si-specific) subunit alpha, partial [Gammaproteobacteria bacterium]|nr:NAD(P)(+) transhydrogenase (Re/Si-specific) subunit alpha [Gemmatimonadota bacterium]NIU74042.1 NAD(P)(+) transhydrogenase (Re/Si-specific) subunit alpha [Gammaproteobacteria bacterium]
AVPGRPAPLLVERSAVEGMARGSVVVDLAADSGGNVEGSVPGEEVMVGGVRMWGGSNVPSQLPVHAS